LNGYVDRVDFNTFEAITTSISHLNGKFDDKIMNVLIVEDSLPTQKILTKMFKNKNWLVECAENGKAGLNFLKNKKFDLVVFDFLMVIFFFIFICIFFKDHLLCNL
jgi:PleD family two-component response regulator